MKKRLNNLKNYTKLIIVISLFVMSFSFTIELYKSRHAKELEVSNIKYKFYIKDSVSGEYKVQTGLVFPKDGYYLDVEKTNLECPNSDISQEGDLSINSLIRFSTVCNLYYNPNGIVTVNSNAENAIATIRVDDKVLASGTVPITAGIRKDENVTITVSDPEYYYTKSGDTYNDYEETFVMPGEDTTKSITLNERPWIIGTLSNSNNTIANEQSVINWHPGYYLVEVWGGKGGDGDLDGGASGYIYGVINIPYGKYVIESAGGNGVSSASYSAGGANGGGRSGGSTSGTGVGGNRGGGGGYSSLMISTSPTNSIITSTINSGIVKFIAGGGGGASARGGTLGASGGGAGGAGGKMDSSIYSITAGKVFDGTGGTSNGNNANTPGSPGRTSGGNGQSGGTDGDFLTGGNGYERGGGGGAGYYGGGGGGVSSLFATAPGGGGGGSSFIANDVIYSGLPSSVTSKLTSSNPSSTGGAIKIQWIGKTMPS